MVVDTVLSLVAICFLKLVGPFLHCKVQRPSCFAVRLSVYLSKIGHITVIAQDVMNNAICVRGVPIENGSNHFSTKS